MSAALERLELVCDTYLAVSTPAQLAAAELLERGAIVRAQIRARIVVALAARDRGDLPAAPREMEGEVGRNLTCCRMIRMEVAIHENDVQACSF